MSALRREIEKVLAEFNRTEPIGAVEAVLLKRFPALAVVSAERWATGNAHNYALLGMEIILVANELREVGQQEPVCQ